MNDLISRQNAVDAILELSEKVADEMLFIDAIVDEIENIPSAETERKKGQWIIRYYDDKSYETKEVNYNPFSLSNPCGIAYCSECGAHPLMNGHEEDVYSKYCPNCGCKMDWSDDE